MTCATLASCRCLRRIIADVGRSPRPAPETAYCVKSCVDAAGRPGLIKDATSQLLKGVDVRGFLLVAFDLPNHDL